MRALWWIAFAATDLPIAVGFGISTAEQFAEVGSFADAAVIGSAIVQRIEENPGREAAAVSEFLSSLTGGGGAGSGRRLVTRWKTLQGRSGYGYRGLAQEIDDLDRRLVQLLNERAQCAHDIGQLKRNSAMPIYEPDREKIIFENIKRNNQGPLSEMQLRQVYERLVDVMRQIQREEMAPEPANEGEATELEPND